MKKTSFILCALLASALMAIAGENASFTGIYSSEWGQIMLVQKDNKVLGVYAGQFQGSLEGQVNGGKFHFRWNQLNGESGRGWFSLSENGLTGKWGNGNSEDDGGDWNANLESRPESGTGPFFGRWETAWGRVALLQLGNQVMGLYNGQYRGLISGTVEEKTLKFEWIQTGEKGHGFFTLNDGNNAFTGKWGSGESDSDGGDWNGTKSGE
ncbi:MAG TPA: hypothetical protein PLM00_00725 [Spirochaetota bacterium]|nr:hypothetical protein [Spirochaetota bacterium]